MSGGQVNITVVDSGSATVIVPGANVQLVMGTATGGPLNQVVATRSPATLQSTFSGGPLVEAAALSALAGGTILALRVTTNTLGTATTLVKTISGTAVPTAPTLDGTNGAWDDYYVKFVAVNGFTLGTAGGFGQVSLDGGRTFGPVLPIGTATTLVIPNTGITLNLGSATTTYIAGDFFTFSTVAPAWNDAGVLAAVNAFLASQYAVIGIGGGHLVGVAAGADASTIEGYLDTAATNSFLYTRLLMSARDAHAPTAWGGAGETEAAWMAAIQADYSAVSARRVGAAAAYWNMPSAFPNTVAGAPRYRRSVAWAWAQRQVTIPPQRHAGRVSDGSLSAIVVDPTKDPQDGFVYHDERINPGLDYLIAGSGGRFASTLTRIGYPGVFLSNPLAMAPLGSNYYLIPLGNVIDVTCDIVFQTGQLFINSDVRLNPNGTIYENDAQAIEATIAGQINALQFGTRQISQPVIPGPGGGVTVDRTWNVQANNSLKITVQVVSRGYVLSETVTVGFQSPNAAT
jgi:hypothetical protein